LKIAALAPEERKRDDGVKLVNGLAEVEGRRRKLKDEMKTLDLEKKDLDDRIAAFAEAAGVTTVAGETADASVTLKDEVHLPTKTHEPEKHEALEDDARKTPELWSEVARLDAHALTEGVRLGRWAGALFEAAESLLERYGRRESSRAVRLKRRRAADED
jgi:hypothetical protein